MQFKNLRAVYIIPQDVEKMHGCLGVSELWTAVCMKLTLFQPTRLCLSEFFRTKKRPISAMSTKPETGGQAY